VVTSLTWFKLAQIGGRSEIGELTGNDKSIGERVRERFEIIQYCTSLGICVRGWAGSPAGFAEVFETVAENNTNNIVIIGKDFTIELTSSAFVRSCRPVFGLQSAGTKLRLS